MAASIAARRLLSRATGVRPAVPFRYAASAANRRFSAGASVPPQPPTPTLPPLPLEPTIETPGSEGTGASSSFTDTGAGGAHRSSSGAAAGARRQRSAGYEVEQEKVLRASLLHVVAIRFPSN
ncbi:hypothetical protein PR202_gn00283 [Eleusine coracana subsp. coracana]|uniref:Uncharacterized protein n=1 Tax=Eleusine coracana subsp. coracana TaxID=191504 RepID=A0AAV5G2L3_ELECO|nr:hypothetical protein PR202_gn00178 [Eleusine coracana subsp. coracana]GJN40968.1 hypothetical protein PR202_gn00283 [Eleusine coracana subsp. coracana]